jgi:ABC-type multidrug transport system ATPase subunit
MKILYGKGEPDPRPETYINVFGYDPRGEQLSGGMKRRLID